MEFHGTLLIPFQDFLHFYQTEPYPQGDEIVQDMESNREGYAFVDLGERLPKSS